MELAAKISDLSSKVKEHRELLLTEEAAKTALIMPFLQALGYEVFNPSEVVPEFSADVGTKKGEKVDYAICRNGNVTVLIECKGASSELSINHAGQLFRYFSVTEARLAILTNGAIFQFYSDIEQPNRMDDRPFFTLNMENVRQSDIKTLEKFTKENFDIEKIVHEAGNLKLQSLIRKELEREFGEPSPELVRLIASRVHDGRLTSSVVDNFSKLIASAMSQHIRDLVTQRLSSALKASGPDDTQEEAQEVSEEVNDVETTSEELEGFRIVQAIAARHIDPKRIHLRDAKSYCAILLDDNNRKSVARLHFNGISTKYLGTLAGKEEERHLIAAPLDIYQHEEKIAARLRELTG